MHPRPRATHHQQQRVRHHAQGLDSHVFFNLLTSPELLDSVESLLPEHRERLFPPTETLSLFLAQAMSADRSCQKVVNEPLSSGWLVDCQTAARIQELIAGRDSGYLLAWYPH